MSRVAQATADTQGPCRASFLLRAQTPGLRLLERGPEISHAFFFQEFSPHVMWISGFVTSWGCSPGTWVGTAVRGPCSSGVILSLWTPEP